MIRKLTIYRHHMPNAAESVPYVWAMKVRYRSLPSHPSRQDNRSASRRALRRARRHVVCGSYSLMHCTYFTVTKSPSYQQGLIHWGRVTHIHIWVSKLAVIGSDNGLSPSHYLNQCWIILNWTLGDKLQRNLNKTSNIFIQRKCVWKCHLRNSGHFVAASMC